MYGYGYSAYNRLSFLSPPPDPSATAFLDATGITDPTIKSAVNTLVVDLKNYGLWDKTKAIYPFVGGTATTHKFNLKDPQDTNAAFRLSFNGGITHSSNGVLGNGTNGYANTFISPLTNLLQNDVCVNIYSRTNTNGNADFGSLGLLGYLKFNDKQYCRINHVSNFSITTTSTPSLGLFSFNRVNSTQESIYKNGSLLDTFSKTSITPTATNTYLLGYNAPAPEYSTKQFAFASIGGGLTPTEASNLYTAVQKFQTTLGRQV